jgi:hypothetical protein
VGVQKIEEENYGLSMNNLKDQREWDRLNKLVLKRTKDELNQCVDINVPPIFGYPPVPYSPPAGVVD